MSTNQHGIEYGSARDLQQLLGYTEWQKFGGIIQKTIKSCQQSENNPQNHFVNATKMVNIGSLTQEKARFSKETE